MADRRLSLSSSTPKEKSKQRLRIGEIAGRTTAECVAICCCCPCGLLSILILAAVKLPAGLFSRAVRKRTLLRKTKKRAALQGSAQIGLLAAHEDELRSEYAGIEVGVGMVTGDEWPRISPSTELSELEKELWSKFSCSGFWRSYSGREE